MPWAAAAEPEDDLVGEAMGDLAGRVFAGILVVLLGEHLRILSVFRIEEKAVAENLTALNAEVAERNHGGGGGRDGPLLHVHLSWHAPGRFGAEGFWRRCRRCLRWRESE